MSAGNSPLARKAYSANGKGFNLFVINISSHPSRINLNRPSKAGMAIIQGDRFDILETIGMLVGVRKLLNKAGLRGRSRWINSPLLQAAIGQTDR